MFMIVRLDTGEEIKMSGYYESYITKGSYKSLRNKYNIVRMNDMFVFRLKEENYFNTIPNHLWEIIEVSDV